MAAVPGASWASALVAVDAGDHVGAQRAGLGAQPVLAGGTAVVRGLGVGGQGGVQPLFAGGTHVATCCVAADEKDGGGGGTPPAEPREQPANAKPSREAAVASSASGTFTAEVLAFESQKPQKDALHRRGQARQGL